MKRWIKSLWKPLLLAVPLLLGMLGFRRTGEPFLQSLFNCICMYALNYQEIPANVLIELSRWLAPVATASGLVLVVSSMRHWLRRLAARCTGRSVAVWGRDPEKSAVLRRLGLRGISMEDSPVRAKQYILLGTEQENLAFYSRNRQLLDRAEVFLRCQSLPAQASTHAGLHLFCPEETAARFFWDTYCPYRLSVQRGHQLRIAILGFSKLGRQLLLQALQSNIFDPGQRIEYHIFGQAGSFPAVYGQLEQIGDPVVFHSEPWYQQLPALSGADMIIVAQQEGQLQLLQELTAALPGRRVYALAADPTGAAMLPAVVCYDWMEEAYHPEHILEDRLNADAQRINLRYAHLYGGVEETEENRRKQWQALDPFTRYSNISAADYHRIQRRIMAEEGWQEPLDGDRLEHLAQLEHIRWCRYHYLNNWRYGVPENGKAKDPQQRIHRCLVDYGALPPEEQEKDRENIRLLLRLDGEK